MDHCIGHIRLLYERVTKDQMKFYAYIVEEPGFKNVKNKHLGMSPF